jgi:hypothetical protein
LALRVTPHSLPARVLALTGLSAAMPIMMDPVTMDATMDTDNTAPGVT